MNCGNPDCTIPCHHKHQDVGPGWAKCQDCGEGYGWPGILTYVHHDPGVALLLNPGDLLQITESNESV